MGSVSLADLKPWQGGNSSCHGDHALGESVSSQLRCGNLYRVLAKFGVCTESISYRLK